MSFNASDQATKGNFSAQGPKISIKRISESVQISLQCAGEYQAMEVYDRLVEAAKKGEVRLDFEMIKRAPPSAR